MPVKKHKKNPPKKKVKKTVIKLALGHRVETWQELRIVQHKIDKIQVKLGAMDPLKKGTWKSPERSKMRRTLTSLENKRETLRKMLGE